MLMRGYQIGPVALEQKTLTCRRWKARRMVPGRVYGLKANLYKPAWAMIRAEAVDQQRWIGDVIAGDWWGHDEVPAGMAPSTWLFATWNRMARSVQNYRGVYQEPDPPDQPVFGIHDALQGEGRCEGFDSWETFLCIWRDMHGQAAVAEPCWRISFVVEEMLVEPTYYGFALPHAEDPWPQGHPLTLGDQIICCTDLSALKRWRADLPYDIVRFDDPIPVEQVLWWHHWNHRAGNALRAEKKPLDHPPAVTVIEPAPRRDARPLGLERDEVYEPGAGI